MDDIRASLERVRERVARAAERAGRRAEEVLLIGVSKTVALARIRDRKSTRLNSSHDQISYAVFCLKKKKKRVRSEEHTSELQSRSDIVCRLLLEKTRRFNDVRSGSVLSGRLLLKRTTARARTHALWSTG